MQPAISRFSVLVLSASTNDIFATDGPLTAAWPSIPATLPRRHGSGNQLSGLSPHSVVRAPPRAGRGCEGGRNVQPDSPGRLQRRARPRASPMTSRCR